MCRRGNFRLSSGEAPVDGLIHVAMLGSTCLGLSRFSLEERVGVTLKMKEVCNILIQYRRQPPLSTSWRGPFTGLLVPTGFLIRPSL